MELIEFSQVKMSIPEIIDKKTSKKYINWGDDNKYPNYIWDSYLKCSNLQAIINTLSDYIIGEGVLSDYEYISDDGENINEVLKKCIFDYILFGGFAIECIRNKQGKIVRLNYQNVMNVRVDEELTTAYLSNSWGSWSGKNVVELPLYDKSEVQDHFLFYYRGHITRNINPIPIWTSALKSVEVLNQTRVYNLNNILNNFNGSVLISLNGTQLKSEEVKEIKRRLEDQYTGAENAGKIVVVNSPNEEGKVDIIRLQPDNASDLYKNLQESSIDDLFVAFRINPILLGKNNSNSGFSKQEFAEAYKLYNKTVINPLQNNIIRALKALGIEIKFNEFKIDWDE